MNQIKTSLHAVKSNSPILYTIVMVHLVLALVCIIGLFVDQRVLTGVNVWLKPLKFSISGAIYIFTVGLLNTFYPFSRVKRNIINNLVSWTLLVEILIIVGQGARGVMSHYNQSSLVDGLLFAAMGILIGVNVLIMLFYIVESVRLKMSVHPAVQVGIAVGWIVVFFGSWVGGQMIGQLSHSVGTVDGGQGLPLVNWSVEAGDLRVAHFFGLHGIQIIPLFAVVLSKRWPTTRTNLITATLLFGLLYAAAIGYTFYQAKQGIPFIKM